MSAQAADGPLKCIRPHAPGTTYFAEHRAGQWLILCHQAGDADYSLLAKGCDESGAPDESE